MVKNSLRTNLHLAWIATVIFMAVAILSCVSEDPDVGNDSKAIKLKLSTIKFPTRADGSDSSVDDGSAIDSHVNRNDLFIASFDSYGNMIEVIVNGKEGTGVSIGETVSLEFSWEMREKVYSGRGDVTIVAIANKSVYTKDGEPILSTISKTLEDLRSSLIFSINPDISDKPTGLPQYGIVKVNPLQFLNGETCPIEIKLYRAVAKVEIVNNMEDAEIISARLLQCNSHGLVLPDNDCMNEAGASIAPSIPADNTETELYFYASEDGKTLYAYVPEMKLGDTAKADNRCIELKVKQNSETVTSKIWLSPYENDEPREATEEEPQWKSLLRNHLYRFNVTGFASSGPKITDTILIRWVHDYTSSNIHKFNKKIYNKLKIKDSNGNWQQCEEIPSVGGLSRFKYHFQSPIKTTNISYVIFGDDVECTEGNLFKDAVAIVEETIDGEKYTCFDLTTDICDNEAGNFLIKVLGTSEEYIYRFYCRNEIYRSIKLENTKSGVTYPKTNLVYDSDCDNGYKYFDFKMVSSPKISYLTYTLFDANGKDAIGKVSYMQKNNLFSQVINGKKYFVFYLD